MFDKNIIIPPYCNKGLEVCERHSESEARTISTGDKSLSYLSHDIDSNPTILRGNSKSAFTLAEVLIALVVIGIIAAITMSTVMPNINERVNSQRQANIVYKVTQATNLMKANGAMVEGFTSTDAFVDELQKYLKIMKRCDSEHIADCWPTKTVRTSLGEEYEVSKTKKRMNLGFVDEYDSNKNVGIVLNDGASLIMTYNPGAKGISITEKTTAITTELPAGGKIQTFLEYTSNTTAGLAFVMDVNGGKGPNSETIGTKMYDIRNLNGAHFSKGCGGKVYDNNFYTVIDSYPPIDCTDQSQSDYCAGDNSYSSDEWAGAKAACASIGAQLISRSDLENRCREQSKTDDLIYSGYYWADAQGDGHAIRVNFGLHSCGINRMYRSGSQFGFTKAICTESL